jgi:type III secretion protein U
MADDDKNAADKTEKPTPKRLKDARRDGDVHKSRELTSTVLTLTWLVMFALLLPTMRARLSGLFDRVLAAVNLPFDQSLPMLGMAAIEAFLWLTVPLLVGAVAVAVLTEYLQVGAVFAPKKVKPDASRLNPMEGIKKLFSQENLVEVIKAIAKSLFLFGLFVWVLFGLLPQIVNLPFAPVQAMASAHWVAIERMGAGVIFVFFFVSVLDAFYQKFAFTKRLRMSRRDIRQEMKSNEGDPMVKGRRRQLHQEWAQQNTLAGVRRASVVVTNPTHLAIAIRYEHGDTDLPLIVAKGADHEAALIREAAEEAGVPIMRNVELARGMWELVEVDEYLPSDFFEAVAELLRWAEGIRQGRDGV